eukprot:139709-Rhodomonas_salina.2
MARSATYACALRYTGLTQPVVLPEDALQEYLLLQDAGADAVSVRHPLTLPLNPFLTHSPSTGPLPHSSRH